MRIHNAFTIRKASKNRKTSLAEVLLDASWRRVNLLGSGFFAMDASEFDSAAEDISASLIAPSKLSWHFESFY